MTEPARPEAVIASVKACEQYRYRISLSSRFDKTSRGEIRSRALEDTNAIFLECTRRYQSIAWVGAGNLSFSDARPRPSDSKSDFLHLLYCFRIIELGLEHQKAALAPGDTPHFVVLVKTVIPLKTKKGLKKLAEDLGFELRYDLPATEDRIPGATRVGGIYRTALPAEKPFHSQPLRLIEKMRAAVSRKLSGLPWLRIPIGFLLRMAGLLVWPGLLAGRALFSIYYRSLARRVFGSIGQGRNLFLYADLRDGRSGDVRGYLNWKYGPLVQPADTGGNTLIPFSHLGRAYHVYSFAAMSWAAKALKRLATDPADGCVLVNYLISPTELARLRYFRKEHRRRVRKQVAAMRDDAGNVIERIIYGEFITALNSENAFALEVSKAYENLFSMLSPGVVVQADAVTKTARSFTACARRCGGQVIYIADRICTRLRTSNQLIADEQNSSGNPHFPNRFVVFDQVTRDEFLRQGVAASDVYLYHREFQAETATPAGTEPSHRHQVVIFLQAYVDHIGAMIRAGVDIAKRLPELEVLFKEHPSYPVCDLVKPGIVLEAPGRIRFLPVRQPVEFDKAVAMVTGYSTAAVPGILKGVPLIWLRRQVDNSVFGKEYLRRIGLAADKSDEVISYLRLLLQGDAATLRMCASARDEVAAIFEASADTFSGALHRAIDDSFDRIRAGTAALQT